jgi:two-component system sensor histidine kinase CpxA
LTQLVGLNGEVFTLFVVPKRSLYGEWIDARTRPLLLLLALIVSAGVSYALARAITRPVHKFRQATVAIAEGHLDTRVAESMGKRHDEIGLLAHDFDSMADKLQRASKRQVELSRNISHELRSPLARLRVALELARRQAGDSTEFNRIEAEAERLDSLIGQILSYSRLETRGTEAPTQIKLAELVQDVVDDVRFECRSDGLEDITVQFSPAIEIDFQGFATALGSAVENVLRNAVHHSESGDKVSVTLRQDEQHAIITIEDNGRGIPDDELERIFEPFYRASSTVASSGSNGSGLGLAIAQRAIQMNAGSMQAGHSAGGGLRIEIRLPLEHESSAQA